MTRTVAALAALTLIHSLGAAPLPPAVRDRPGPTLVIQTQSVDELDRKIRAMMEPFADLMRFAGETEEFDLKKIVGQEYFAGIDGSRRFAAYVTLNENIFASQVVVMIPVSEEPEFIKLLKAQGVGVAKTDDGYQLEVPEVPLPVFMRYLDRYAYLSLASAEPLDGKFRLAPEAVISAEETAATTVWLRVDRIPQPLKEMALSHLESLPGMMPDSTFIDPKLGKVARLSAQLGERWAKTFLADAKEVIVRFDLEPKSGAFVSEVTVEAKPDSELAKALVQEPLTNRFASLGGDDPMMRYLIKLPLFDGEAREIFVTLAEFAEQEILKEAPEEVRKIYPTFNAGLIRTLKAGELDIGLMGLGPDGEGHYTAVYGFSYLGGSELAKVWKETLTNPPAGAEKVFAFDTRKIAGVAVHEARLGELDLDEEARKGMTNVFGDLTVYYAFTEDRVVAAMGADAEKALAEALKAKPAAARMITTEQSMKKYIDVMKKASGQEIPDEALGMFGGLDRMEFFGMDVRFNEGKLTLRAETGAAMFMGFGMTFAMRAGAPPPPPVRLPPPPPPPIKD